MKSRNASVVDFALTDKEEPEEEGEASENGEAVTEGQAEGDVSGADSEQDANGGNNEEV